MEWKPRYSVGDVEIDDQHKVFIRLVNRLKELDTLTSKSEIAERVDELEAYAVYHFAREEKRMEETEYPGLSIHREQHANLLDNFKKIRLEMELEQKTVYELVQFLIKWFIFHTTGEDNKLSVYLNSHSGRSLKKN